MCRIIWSRMRSIIYTQYPRHRCFFFSPVFFEAWEQTWFARWPQLDTHVAGQCYASASCTHLRRSRRSLKMRKCSCSYMFVRLAQNSLTPCLSIYIECVRSTRSSLRSTKTLLRSTQKLLRSTKTLCVSERERETCVCGVWLDRT